MNRRVKFTSKLKLLNVGVAKASFKMRLVSEFRPETKWSKYEQVDNKLNIYRRTEPVHVAICWDDLYLGVKG